MLPIALAVAHLFVVADDTLYALSTDAVAPRQVAKLPGQALAVATNGTWAAHESRKGGHLVVGQGTKKLFTYAVNAELASFDGEGKRLAAVTAAPGGKHRLVILAGGKVQPVQSLTYTPTWVLWVDGKPVIPGADGTLAKAAGPIPAKTNAERTVLSSDGKTCTLMMGSPGSYTIVVSVTGLSKKYPVKQGRECAYLAVDSTSAYYGMVYADRDEHGSGTYKTANYRLDFATGKSIELKPGKLGYLNIVTPKK